MFVGVNGVGKTTTIGKLAAEQVGEGHRVVLAAADTFRAAAADQLDLWAERTGGELVHGRGRRGSRLGRVRRDGGGLRPRRRPRARRHRRPAAHEVEPDGGVQEAAPDRGPHRGRLTEVLLVIDASTGQNGLVQAKQFAEAVDVTGIVLTKLDGTAKGGIVLAIQSGLGLPVKAVGVGEGVEDLVGFDPQEFEAALFDSSS